MQQVNVFIETSSRFRGNVERKCGYVLSTQLRTGKETREHFGRVTGTYHQAILLTMVDALDHMTRTCDVCFYISDLYVTSRLGKITEMAGSGWLDTKGKPIANREEWCRLFKAINQLPDPHEITAKTEKHSYSAWLREEMKTVNVEEYWGKGWSLRPEQDILTMECLGTIIKSGIRFTYYKDEKGGIWFDDEPIGGKPEWMQRADKERRRRHRRHP